MTLCHENLFYHKGHYSPFRLFTSQPAPGGTDHPSNHSPPPGCASARPSRGLGPPFGATAPDRCRPRPLAPSARRAACGHVRCSGLLRVLRRPLSGARARTPFAHDRHAGPVGRCFAPSPPDLVRDSCPDAPAQGGPAARPPPSRPWRSLSPSARLRRPPA